MSKYGSLDMWSTQGMEKSHYRAKGVYFKNTRHGGGTTRSNYMKDMFDWFFHCTLGRCHAIERARKSNLGKEVRIQSRLNAKEKWTNSTRPLNHARWRETRHRVVNCLVTHQHVKQMMLCNAKFMF